MKKIWIIFASILSVILIVATSVDAAVEADLSISAKTATDSSLSADSGRIKLDEKAYAEIKSEITSISPVSEIVSSIDDGNTGLSDTTSNTDENDPLEPSSDDLIWLAVDGDNAQEDNPDSPGDSFDNNLNVGISGSYASPTTEVDEVFVASDGGLVNKEVSIGTTLSLNIVGRAEIEVLSGSENLVEGPYFNGLDIVDRLNLAVASASIMFLIRAVQLLDVAFPLADAIVIATTIYTWVINGVISAIQNGIEFLDAMIDIGISITIGGITYTLPGTIRSAIISLIGNILSVLERFVGNILEELLLPIAEQSIDNIIEYLEGLRDDLFGNPDFRTLFGQLYSNAHLAVYAILQVLERKDTQDVEAYFEQIGLSHNVAQSLVSILNLYDGIFVGVRDGIFGKFDLFTTYGRDSTALRSVRAQINPYCQVPEGSYAAVIKIKAISAGQVFDSKTIGIIYEGNDNGGIPDSSENMYTSSSSSTVSSSTMSDSGTSFGSTSMSSTTQTSGLQ